MVNTVTLDPTQRTDDAVAGADHGARVGVQRAGARFELTDKAVVQAVKVVLLGFSEVQIGDPLPRGNGQVAYPGRAPLAEPAHEAGECQAGNAVGQQEVQVFVSANFLQGVFDSHHFLT